MKNFNWGGSGLSNRQGYDCSINKKNKLPLRRLDLPINRNRFSVPLRFNRGNVACGWGLLSANSHLLLAFTIIFCVLCLGPDLLGTSAMAQSQHRDKYPLVSPAFGKEAKGLNEVQPLHIGQRVPDEFWIKEHLFFINGDTIRRTLEEHKGKMLVLDFWFSGCTPCLLHQREIKHFKIAYPKELAVVMINSKKTRERYDVLLNHISSGRFEKAGMDGLVSIIEDSYLESMFPYYCFPSYFWINESGVLQTHTFRNLLDRQYVSPFLLKK